LLWGGERGEYGLSLSLMLRPTVSRPVGQSVLEQSTHLGLQPDFYYYQTVAGLLIWDALSDERKGLSFKTAAGPRQRCHSRAWVPCDSRPHFTVSYSRLPFSSPPTIRRATVEVFYPASTRELSLPILNWTLRYNHFGWTE
jgi:hypothetical protein